MATTSPDNIRTPNPGDPYNLVPDLATLAGDVQAALISRANTYTGTASQRASFTSSAPEGTLWVDTDGQKNIWRKSGPDWINAVTRGGFLPFSMAAGSASITPVANTPTSLTITFPPGRFTQTPVVTATAYTSSAAVENVSISNPSVSSVDLVLLRSNTTPTSVQWMAVQMTAASGPG